MKRWIKNQKKKEERKWRNSSEFIIPLKISIMRFGSIQANAWILFIFFWLFAVNFIFFFFFPFHLAFLSIRVSLYVVLSILVGFGEMEKKNIIWPCQFQSYPLELYLSGANLNVCVFVCLGICDYWQDSQNAFQFTLGHSFCIC